MRLLSTAVVVSQPLANTSGTRPKKHMHSHPQTNRFNSILQFPVMQNTAAIVFQGEAEWGWLSLQHGATPGPICSLSRHSSMVVSPASISVTLYCPHHYSSVCKTFFIKSLSAQCSAAWSMFVCSLACPFLRFAESLMKITPQATEILV